MGSILYSKRHDPEHSRSRKKRPKSFSSVASAKKWAETNKIKDYDILPLSNAVSGNGKLIVVKK